MPHFSAIVFNNGLLRRTSHCRACISSSGPCSSSRSTAYDTVVYNRRPPQCVPQHFVSSSPVPTNAAPLHNVHCGCRGEGATTSSTRSSDPPSYPCAWAPGKPAATTCAWVEELATQAIVQQRQSGSAVGAGRTQSPLAQLLGLTAARVRAGVNNLRYVGVCIN